MRVNVIFKGNVQGVGFRYTCVMISRRYTVTGYVQNLPDGTVRVVAEGDKPEIESFIDEIHKRKGMNIRSVLKQDQPATGEFSGFRVRY